MPTQSAKAPSRGLHPEAELLCCCARTQMDAENAARIRALLRDNLDWAYLLQIAALHRVMPLLYWHLNTICPDAVPQATLELLRDYFHATDLRNRFLTDELLTLLHLFDAHDIPAIPYKGPVLAATAYGNLTFRQFGDLDILVPKRDLPKATDLLISHGYRQHYPTAAQEAAHLHSGHAYTFVHEAGRGTVDLHWQFASRSFPFPFDPACVWERLKPVSFAGTTVRGLPLEDVLLLLCVHGSRHGWPRLGWICDVAELLRVSRELDWPWVMAQARTLGSERMLLLGLLLARELLGAPLPTDVVHRIQANPVVPSLAARVCERLFTEADGLLHTLVHLLGGYVFPARVLERLQDKVRYALRLAHGIVTPSAKDRVLLPLPACLAFLYYVLRPMRALGTYARHPLLPARKSP